MGMTFMMRLIVCHMVSPYPSFPFQTGEFPLFGKEGGRGDFLNRVCL
jgi:hypothetical protein